MGRGHSRSQTILGQRRNGTYPTHEYALRPLSDRLGTTPSERFAEAQPLIWAVHVGGSYTYSLTPVILFLSLSFFLSFPSPLYPCSKVNMWRIELLLRTVTRPSQTFPGQTRRDANSTRACVTHMYTFAFAET